jgi:hypothetical protein
MDKQYILKHKNIDVLEFCLDKETQNVDYVKILDDKFSPLNPKASEGGKIVSFNGWLVNRSIPNSREGVERLKKYYKIDDLKQIMLSQYGLSLSDHYWIDRKPFNNKWENINLFENKYNDVIGRMLFDSKFKIVEEIEDYNPNVSTGGKLKKYWEFDKDEYISYLIKGSSGPYYQEPFNEYFCSLLSHNLNFKHTSYTIEKRNGEWVSKCKCIADTEIEMVDAEDLRRKYGINRTYEGLIMLAAQMSFMELKDGLHEMIILDYITENTDRHWNNFGILRNGNTGLWVGVIPIYDNGYTLWNNDFVSIEIPSSCLSFAETNDDCLKYVNISDYIRKSPDMLNIFNTAFESYENIERKKSLKYGISIKQQEINEHIEKT